jgi:hypothetical protein
MFICKAGPDLPPRPEAVTSESRLTSAEVRLLFAIVQIGGVPEVALVGVSDQTVNSHVHRIHEKTGIKRHADPVKLVAS